MEAIIRTNDRNVFDALLYFLKTLNITVETKEKPIGKTSIREHIKKTEPSRVLGITEFQKLLLNGPVMSDDDFNYFQKKRNEFNRWK